MTNGVKSLGTKSIERALTMLEDLYICENIECYPGSCSDCQRKTAEEARVELGKILEAAHGLISAIEMKNICAVNNSVDELKEVLEDDH